MNMDILQKNDIFLIPIGDYLYCEKSAYYIVYSPLKGRMLAADNKGLEQLHEIAESKCSAAGNESGDNKPGME